jgi:hypothetical protein
MRRPFWNYLSRQRGQKIHKIFSSGLNCFDVTIDLKIVFRFGIKALAEEYKTRLLINGRIPLTKGVKNYIIMAQLMRGGAVR